MSYMAVEVSTSNSLSSVGAFTFVSFASSDTRGLFSLAREGTKLFLKSEELLHNQELVLLSVLTKSVAVGLLVTNVLYCATNSSNIHMRIVKT